MYKRNSRKKNRVKVELTAEGEAGFLGPSDVKVIIICAEDA